jgi:ATPase family protein associated with various cellular activities (AAA)/winged helix domain-containing protein
MLSRRASKELRTAMQAFEELVALRLEERGAVVAGSPEARLRGLARRPLGLPGSDNLPPPEAFAGEGPLGRLVEGYELTPAESVAVVAALAPEVDEKFDVLYARLSDRGDTAALTGEVLRTLVGRSWEGRLRAADLLAPGGKLRGLRLLQVDGAGPTALGARAALNPELAAWLLGRHGQEPEFSPEFPAQRLRTVHGIDDLILEPGLRQRLDEVLARIRLRQHVLAEWGLGAHHDNAEGYHVLLHGPPGTGKTMTAAVLGAESGLPVYRVDLSALVSKWIGETAKNLAHVFDRAEARGWLLFFDEADSIFGRRAEVTDARDRYANQEVSYLLQRLETFDGVSLLATNLPRNVDDAFLRRVHAHLEFAEPREADRARLWRAARPRELPLADDVDFDALAARFPMTGAEIRNALFDAAYRAGAAGEEVGAAHLHAAIHAEYEKAGRVFPAAAEAVA